tara:strand:+ start:3304 stop:4533 length:1230 start_codon:yes stop_codon:yes gene_type:complete
MANINNISILSSDLDAAGENRSLFIESDIGAEVTIQIVSSNNQFYNFITKTFTSVFASKNKLNVSLSTGFFEKLISFPAASSVKYFVIVSPKPYTDTIIDNGVYIQEIGSVSDATITFATATASTAKYTSDPAITNTTTTASPSASVNKIVTISGTLNNATTDANSNGLILTRPIISPKDFFFETTENVSSNPAGDAVSSVTVIVADLTDLAIGMTLRFHKGTTAPTAGTVIKSIDVTNKTLTFNNAVAFEDGETMTFRAIGLESACNAIGAKIILGKNILTPSKELVTTTVRSAVSGSGTIPVQATQGIAGGRLVNFNGFKVDNSATNKIIAITTADPSGGDNDGVITCEANQTLSVGTKLTFVAANPKHFLTTAVTILADLIVTKFPLASKTISLDIDNFITSGAAS